MYFVETKEYENFEDALYAAKWLASMYESFHPFEYTKWIEIEDSEGNCVMSVANTFSQKLIFYWFDDELEKEYGDT